MELLEKNIVLTLCKLEKIFPPAFFDSMEHLPIHLAYEAKVGGPVQYRWMYPFERLMHDLKKKVKNPAAVEGSIVQAYLLEEISNFCSHYFEPIVQTRLNQVPRNDDGDELDCMDCLSIFTHPGRSFGNHVKRYFDDYVRQCCPNISEEDLEKRPETEFPTWFSSYVENHQVDSRLNDLAQGPSKLVTCYKGYFVNGFRFHTKEYGKDKKTFNRV